MALPQVLQHGGMEEDKTVAPWSARDYLEREGIIWAMPTSRGGLPACVFAGGSLGVCRRFPDSLPGAQHPPQGSFSAELSAGSSFCLPLARAGFLQAPQRGTALAAPRRCLDSTFLFVYPSKETTRETAALSPCQSQAPAKSLMYLEKHTVLPCLLWRNLANPS